MDPEGVDGMGKRSDGDISGVNEGGRVYHGGGQDPWVLDFSTSVNPKTPPGTARVYESALASARSYPADDYSEFRAAAAAAVDCEPRQVVPAPGGTGAIRLAIATTVASGDEVLVPEPGFGQYAKEVRLQGGEPVFADPRELLQRDPSAYAMVVVCAPNNPTGYLPERQSLIGLAERCHAADTTLLLDEAFLGFTDQSSLAGRDGVIVARSLSKLYGLAGLRCGYAVATGSALDRLETARLPSSLSVPAAAVGGHAFEQSEFVEETRVRVSAERERMRERLGARFEVEESAGPFLLVDAGSADAVDDILSELRGADIVVRDARTIRGLDSHVRIAVRLPDENDRLLAALDV